MKLCFRTWTVPLALLVLLIVSFGVMIPFLGFYWDDWPVLLTARQGGAEGFWEFYQYDRPVSAWTYIVTMPILGSTPLNWHIFTLLLRWLTTVAFWWTFTKLWPNHRREVTWAALLFAIYPVFKQQSISVAYSQHWICYLLFVFSLGAMIQSWRSPRWFWPLTILGVAASALQMVTMEYFAGLELLRPVLLWFLAAEIAAGQNQSWRWRVKQVALRWLPYLLALVGFVIWRMFFLEFPGEDANPPLLLNRFFSEPLQSTLRFLQISLQDMNYLLLNAWSSILSLEQIDLLDRFNLFTWGVAALVAGAVAWYMLRLRPEPAAGRPVNWTVQALVVGVIAVLLGMLPVWFTDRQIIVGMYSNRFGLPAMLGVSILVVALIEWLIAGRVKQLVILCLMVGIAVGSHLRVANDYRWSWVKQTRFYWQLAWRAPYIEPNTAVYSDGEIFSYVGLYSTAAGITLLYPPFEPAEKLPYWFYSLGREFAHQMTDFVSGFPLNTDFRHYTFQGSSKDGLVIYYEPAENDCLLVLSPEDEDIPGLPEVTQVALPNSDLSRIQDRAYTPGYPPEDIFGPEPEHSWCYYFQKAELAHQLGDWQKVAALGDEAQAKGFNLSNSASNTWHEWLPFIESYAMLERWDEAAQLTFEADQAKAVQSGILCELWTELKDRPEPGAQSQQKADEVLQSLDCQP